MTLLKAAGFENGALVWWFRSSLRSRGGFVKRTSEPNRTRIMGFRCPFESEVRKTRVLQGRVNFGFGTLGCYKPTVNESETINEAKPLCLVGDRSEAGGRGLPGSAPPAGPLVERS
jgi:hypothetical protein